jgi:hypothetical protein
MSTDPRNVYNFRLEGDVGADPLFVAPDIKANLFAREVISGGKRLLHVNYRTPSAVFQD